MMDIDTARMVLSVLEYYRRATGVDEWDESDDRCLLYCEAWQVLGEAEAYEVLGEASTTDRLEHREDVIGEVLDTFRAEGAKTALIDRVALTLGPTLRRAVDV
jgi:hypothetical protein